MLRKILLGCGIVSSVLYVVSDVVGTLRYPGYSYRDQWFSELTAQGSPVRPLMIALNEIPYNLLVLAFAAVVRESAGLTRAGRITAATLAEYAAFGFVTGVIFPMPTREVAAAGKGTLRNTCTFSGDVGDVTLLCAGRGLRVDVTRKAVPILLVWDTLGSPRVWRFDKPTGSPD